MARWSARVLVIGGQYDVANWTDQGVSSGLLVTNAVVTRAFDDIMCI